MKSLALFVLLFVVAGTVNAQDTTAAIVAYHYPVKQDTLITELMAKYREYNITREFEEGYRIQINYTNVREEIYKNKGAMYREFPQLASYVEYEQPYYKLRLGDFKTRLDASYYLQQIILVHPGAFIVKDKIKIK